LRSEVESAITQIKTGKAAGPDEICVEMLQALNEEGIFWSLIDETYETGKIPIDMLKSVFIALPKVSGTPDCTKHRKIV